MDKAVALAGELRASGVRVTLVVHEHKRLGRGIELATLAKELTASDVGLEFLTGELQGSHDPSGVVFTVLAALSGMEREYIRDRTLEGHESARKRGKTIGCGLRACGSRGGVGVGRGGARWQDQPAGQGAGGEDGAAAPERHGVAVDGGVGLDDPAGGVPADQVRGQRGGGDGVEQRGADRGRAGTALTR